ncbi:Protein of unknown function (plasmid) [Magnetospira sp. QH-2]|nr:Protein of unknown function [Magnetospira sp. QH-2]
MTVYPVRDRDKIYKIFDYGDGRLWITEIVNRKNRGAKDTTIFYCVDPNSADGQRLRSMVPHLKTEALL